jgi:FixJ family two-component response regulator
VRRFFAKTFRKAELLSAVKQALERSTQVVQSRALLTKLTPREFEVFVRVVGGLANKQIADVLGLSERTIKAHRASVMQKIGVVSVVELVRFALEAGVAPAQPGTASRCQVQLTAAWHKQLTNAD